MKSWSAIIVDDESLARVNLIRHLKSFDRISIVGEADSCSKAIEIIQEKKPHVVFLDVQLIGESGFDILDKIDPDIQIVFITAYDQYAIRAFEVNAVDYLLKPINPERLASAIKRLKSQDTPQAIQKEEFEYEDSIFVKLNNRNSSFVKIKHIRYISSYGNYTKLNLVDDSRSLILKTMKGWTEDLPRKYFLRVHHSCIANINFIERIEKNKSGQYHLVLKDSEEILSVSRRYMTSLKGLFKASD